MNTNVNAKINEKKIRHLGKKIYCFKMHYCSNFFEANLLLTAVTFLGVTVTVTAVIFFVNAEGYVGHY